VVKIIDFKEVRKKDKEIETLKILIEKKDNTIVSLQKQLDNKCVEMIHLRKQHYKLRKEEDTFIDKISELITKKGERR
jgi:hypothetical protein|tara:strand:+ start:157 stop:390 length:234 start_codon:yes stop_codon:yes gene_type:complete